MTCLRPQNKEGAEVGLLVGSGVRDSGPPSPVGAPPHGSLRLIQALLSNN